MRSSTARTSPRQPATEPGAVNNSGSCRTGGGDRDCYECMVRRGTAREKFGREDKSAQMYSAFGWRVVLLARMRCARVCPFKTRWSLKTIRNTRLRTRRCDCSFVFTYPVQTSVGKLQSVVVVVWESGSAQRFQAEGAFSTPLGGDGPVLVAAGEHGPGDASQLVGHGDHDDVLVRSGVECVEPRSNRCSVALDMQHRCSRAVNQDPAQARVTSLTDAKQLRLTTGRVLTGHDAEPRCKPATASA